MYFYILFNLNKFFIWKGFGKRYYHDTAHESNEVFLTREPFVKREPHEIYYRQLRTNSTPAYTYHKRFPKRHETKLTSAGEHSRVDLKEYLEMKQARQPVNSLNFESEIVNKHIKAESAKLIATQPFRKHFIHPWKYSYKKNDYQTCSEEFRRVRTQCIDLSKY